MKKLIAFILIFAAGLVYFLQSGSYSNSDKEFNFSSLPTEKISYGEISSVISGRGKIVPNRLVPVYAPIEGKIKEMLVREGQKVKQGQCLVKITVKPKLKNTLLHMKLDFMDIDYKKNELDRQIAFQRKLYKEGLTALTQIEALEERVERLELKNKYVLSKLELWQKQTGVEISRSSLINDELFVIGNSCVSAIIDGTVLLVNKDEDDFAFPGSGFGGDPIMVMADLSKYFVRYKVSEIDLNAIKVGQRVEINLDSQPEKLFNGEIHTISSMAFSNRMDVPFIDPSKEMSYYEIRILITDTVQDLRTDLSCRISIKTATRSNVLLAPIVSVFRERDGNQFVFVRKNGDYRQQQVQTGMADENMIEIQSGLEKGELVYLSPLKIIEQRKIVDLARSKSFIEKIFQ